MKKTTKKANKKPLGEFGTCPECEMVDDTVHAVARMFSYRLADMVKATIRAVRPQSDFVIEKRIELLDKMIDHLRRQRDSQRTLTGQWREKARETQKNYLDLCRALNRTAEGRRVLEAAKDETEGKPA